MQQKKKQSSAAEILRGGILFLLMALFNGIRKTVAAVRGWNDYSSPAKQVAAWYYFGVSVPAHWLAQWFTWPWWVSYQQHATHFSRVNAALAVTAIIFQLVITWLVIVTLLKLLFRILGRMAIPLVLLIVLGPIAFLGCWRVIS